MKLMYFKKNIEDYKSSYIKPIVLMMLNLNFVGLVASPYNWIYLCKKIASDVK